MLHEQCWLVYYSGYYFTSKHVHFSHQQSLITSKHIDFFKIAEFHLTGNSALKIHLSMGIFCVIC
jgi:hypothetical protein